MPCWIGSNYSVIINPIIPIINSTACQRDKEPGVVSWIEYSRVLGEWLSKKAF